MSDSEDTIDITYPCYVLAAIPVHKSPDGQPVLRHCHLAMIEDNTGTPLLLVFRQNSLAIQCSEAITPDNPHAAIPVESYDVLLDVLANLAKSNQQPVGILLDPDERLQGYPLPPENWLGPT